MSNRSSVILCLTLVSKAQRSSGHSLIDLLQCLHQASIAREIRRAQDTHQFGFDFGWSHAHLQILQSGAHPPESLGVYIKRGGSRFALMHRGAIAIAQTLRALGAQICHYLLAGAAAQL